MKQIYPYLYYLSMIPIIVGIIKWKYLNYPFKVFLLIMIFSSMVGTISRNLTDRNLLFYINAIGSATLYGFFFTRILYKTINVRYVWLSVFIVWVVIGAYIATNGIHQFQLQVVIPFDLFMIAFSGIYIYDQLKRYQHKSDAVLLLVSYLFISFCIATLIDLISNYLKAYLSDNFLNLLWQDIVPIYNLLKIFIITVIMLSIKPKLPSLDKMPDFAS